MGNFDKNRVLERILEEAPTLSNRRGEIEIKVPVYNVKGEQVGEERKKRVIYAFYSDSRVPDPDLYYHRKANPLPTTPDSTLCEIYSFWEGDPNVQEFLKREIKEGRMKEGDVIHQGPFVTGYHGHRFEEPQGARDEEEFNFFYSVCYFSRHFNKICEELGYEPRIEDFGNSNCYLTLQIPAQVSLSIAGKVSYHDTGVKMPMGIDFYREDPALSKALELISETYDRLSSGKFARVDVRLYKE